MADKPKVPKGIEEYFLKKRVGNAYLVTHENELIAAHQKGIENGIKVRKSNVKDEADKKKIDFSSLDLNHIATENFIDSYVSGFKAHILEKAKADLGISADTKFKNTVAEEKLLHMYSGFTDQSLRQFYRDMIFGNDKRGIKKMSDIGEFRSSTFINQYNGSEHAEHVRNVITSDAVAHLNGTKHIDDILKYTGAEAHIDDKTLIQTARHLIGHLEHHKNVGRELNAKETYDLLPEQIRAAGKYHSEAMKAQKKAAAELSDIGKGYVAQPKK